MKKFLLTLILSLAFIGVAFAADNHKSSTLYLTWNPHTEFAHQNYYSFTVEANDISVEPTLQFIGHRPYIEYGSKMLKFNGPISKLDVYEFPIVHFGPKKKVMPYACQNEVAQALAALNKGKNVQLNITGMLTGNPQDDVQCSVKIS